MNNYFQKMTEIYNHLQDEESKLLFEGRISYLISNDMDEYIDRVAEFYHDWFPSKELEEAMDGLNHAPDGIVIYGCGYGGKMTQKILSFWGYETSYYCDTWKYGKEVNGKKVLSVEEVVQKCRDYLVVIASYEHGKEMYDELIKRDFPRSHILYPWHGILLGSRGNQYFDLFPPRSDEVFVDAGAFDGKTVVDFCEWTNGNYTKIYAFEPVSEMCEAVKKKAEDNHIPSEKIEILHNAAWDKMEEIYFTEDGSDSHIDNSGEIVVQGLDIDTAVKDEKVTFIKMDIEGSERKALEGAKNTIINNHPRLAICIYHKPEDVIDLASYILELVPEYKLYIRQYTSHMWETVLYAVL